MLQAIKLVSCQYDFCCNVPRKCCYVFPKQYRINLDQDAVKKSHYSLELFPAWIHENILDGQEDEPSKDK